MHRLRPLASLTNKYDAKSYADVTASAAGVVSLAADARRVGAWFSLNQAIALTALQAVNICVTLSGKAVALASISVGTPSVYLAFEKYGSLIKQAITLVSPGGNQPVSYGDILEGDFEESHVDQTPS